MASIVENNRPGGTLNVEGAVRDRYTAAAQRTEAELCCPVEYDGRYLQAIPEEIIRKDYGCGDPSKYLNAGEVVLDLGAGGGKVCYIAAQIVGREGAVVGVDCNEQMLALARKHQPQIAERLGYDNVRFLRGQIQDLKLNLDLLDRYLEENPVGGSSDWLRVQEHAEHLRHNSPLIADDSVDVVVSNCVLNLVRPEDRDQMFSEMHRVLRRGGRAVISDVVSDETVPERLRQDPRLWSGCISGAFREDLLLQAFERAGFYGMQVVARQQQPWAVVEGIEFRSTTVRAFKGKEGPCLERHQAVIYNGPWKAVIDDDGHKLVRGQRTAVCDKTFSIYSRPPYARHVTPIAPTQPVPLQDAEPFDCRGPAVRSPRVTKGAEAAQLTRLPENDCCGPDGCC